MTRPSDRSSDDMFDNTVTAAREHGAGRLLGHTDDDEATAIAEEADDDSGDELVSAEEAAMHLTAPPSFDDSDGYVDD